MVVGTCEETFEVATSIQEQAPLSEVEGVRETYGNVQGMEEKKACRTADASDGAGIRGDSRRAPACAGPLQTPPPLCARPIAYPGTVGIF